MIIVALILILAGSFAGAIAAWLQDAFWWQIAIAYVGGGWAGLLGGLPVVMAIRHLAGPRREKRRQLVGIRRHQRQG